MMIGENVKPRRIGRRGAVSMELVVVCVLIAAACMIGIAVMGRAIFRSTDLMSKGASGQGELAATAVSCPKEGYRKQVEDDVKEAEKFNSEFSDIKK